MLIFSIITALTCKALSNITSLIISTIFAYAIVAEAIWSIEPDVYIFSSAILLGFLSIPIALKIKLPQLQKSQDAPKYTSIETGAI